MPIILSPSVNSGPVSGFPTAQSVVNSVATDLLQRIAPENPVLLDYINRVQLQLLRVSRWKFLLSSPQRFVTRRGRSDYWIGTAGAASIDTIDTGLNIGNLGPIKTDTFYDRSTFRLLKRITEAPLMARFMYRDDSPRLSKPRMWRNDVSTPNIINLYPAPDNQNNFQPVPEPPALSTVAGGSLAARIYFVRTTFVDSLGNESSASTEGFIFIPANSVLVVQPPQELPTADSGIAYNSWNVYIFNAGNSETVTTGNETLANQSGALSNTVTYQEPNAGFLTGGRAFPTANNVAQMGGYLIEFRYFQAKPQVNSLSNTLLIPQDYLDILIAGVNYFTAQFIKDQAAETYWKAEYQSGITGMIRDKNLFPRAPDFIRPDIASQSYEQFFGLEVDPDYYNPGLD